jgi:hypothetical protein
MEKYNQLCVKLKGKIMKECEKPEKNDVQCELLHMCYNDCIRFREHKIRAIIQGQHNEKDKSEFA